MKLTGSPLLLATCLVVANTASAFASDWLHGTYVNEDKDQFIHEVLFCEDGKALARIERRTYAINVRDGKRYVEFYWNGAFSFEVSKDEQKLLPADDFTREWFTATALTRDPARTETCDW
ncbi:hypothetical protein [Breoghania sp. JC706]|uniref:hypothetical protein n=1 Tax=Breoghania sp. JC706 TaxID=3117732 RepID=UPI003008D95F